MSQSTSVTVGGHFAAFIEAQVNEGHHGSASEVVGSGLRLLEEREASLAAARQSLAAGEESGASTRLAADIWPAVRAGLSAPGG